MKFDFIKKIKAESRAKGEPLPGNPVAAIRDYRKLYERPDIDAVVVPSTNYWHTLHAIYAVQAGKHVYVEKSCMFKHWEVASRRRPPGATAK